MSARPHRPWGPALSSASGAPEPVAPRSGAAPAAPRSCVRLPVKAGDAVEVFVNGVPQREGSDFHRVGRLLVFARLLAVDEAVPARRVLGLRRRGRRAPADVVDVRYVLDGHRLTARALRVDRAG